jgi:hypothetical protein
MKRRQAALWVSMMSVSLGLAFLAGETVATLAKANPFFEPGLYVGSHRFGWVLGKDKSIRQKQPDFDVVYHTDGTGRRITTGNERSGTRIVFYGDSYTFGVGLTDDSTMPSLLSGALPRAEVLNRGVAGYSPDQYYIAFLDDLADSAARPDLAVFIVFPENDYRGLISDHMLLPSARWRYKPCLEKAGGDYRMAFPKSLEHPYQARGQDTAISLFRSVFRKSELLRFLNAKLRDIPALAPVNAWIRGRKMDRMPENLPEGDRRFEFLVREIRKQGIPTLFVVIPSERLLVDGDDGYLEAETYRKVMRILRESGVETLDMLSLLPRERGLYFAVDGHFNPRGAALTAGAMGERLTRMKVARL